MPDDNSQLNQGSEGAIPLGDVQWLFKDVLGDLPLRTVGELFGVSGTAVLRYRDGTRTPQGDTARLIDDAIAWAQSQMKTHSLTTLLGKKKKPVKKHIQNKLAQYIVEQSRMAHVSNFYISEFERQLFQDIVQRNISYLRLGLEAINESFSKAEGQIQRRGPYSAVELFDVLNKKGFWKSAFQDFASQVLGLVAKELWVALGRARKDSATQFIDRIQVLAEGFEQSANYQAVGCDLYPDAIQLGAGSGAAVYLKPARKGLEATESQIVEKEGREEKT